MEDVAEELIGYAGRWVRAFHVGADGDRDIDPFMDATGMVCYYCKREFKNGEALLMDYDGDRRCVACQECVVDESLHWISDAFSCWYTALNLHSDPGWLDYTYTTVVVPLIRSASNGKAAAALA